MKKNLAAKGSLKLQQHPALFCFLSGLLIPLALAPFDWWPIAIISIALFVIALQEKNRRHVFLLSWLFGIGMFSSGISWVYVSIHDYGYAPVWLATFLTLLFAIFLGLAFALPFFIYTYINPKAFSKNNALLVVIFPALWVLGEWSRSWILTGFPWLYLGYGHINSPLAGWFPVAGVYGASFIAVFAGCALTAFSQDKKINPLIYTMSLFICGFGLQKIHWTDVRYDSPVSVGIVQPNFALEDKWNPEKRQLIRDTLEVMSQPLWQQDIILWPEAALSELYQDVQPFLNKLDAHGKNTHTTLITGIPFLEQNTSDALVLRQSFSPVYYNSITALGYGSGLYHKVRLVPFGEYVPLEKWLRGIIRFFDLPMSEFSKGPEQQELLTAGVYHVAPFICYEVVYPDLVAHNAHAADFLITVSNDSWFGASLGPLQHLEMAQARALETQRFMIRGTNNGISAIIDAQGKIQQASAQFSQEILSGTIYPVKGETPFMRFGSTPFIALLIFLLLAIHLASRIRFFIQNKPPHN